MNTDDPKAFTSYEHEGQTYYFCSDRCLEKFKENPAAYWRKEVAEKPLPPQSPDAERYICPMHPEVVRDTPGNCPKCGMALEPRSVSTGEEETNPEYEDMLGRFIVGAIFSVPVVIIAMRGLIPDTHFLETLTSAKVYEWLEFLLATPVGAVWPFYVRGVQSVVNRNLNMFTLVGLAHFAGSGSGIARPQPYRRRDQSLARPGAQDGKEGSCRRQGRDPIKPTTPEAIRQLHEENIRVVMLTGDNKVTAEAVARKLDIDEVVAEVLPDEKAAIVKRFKEEGKIVAMAGDGINDAPALAQAQVGIAMGIARLPWNAPALPW